MCAVGQKHIKIIAMGIKYQCMLLSLNENGDKRTERDGENKKREREGEWKDQSEVKAGTSNYMSLVFI